MEAPELIVLIGIETLTGFVKKPPIE